MTTKEIAAKLAAFCRQGKWEEAQRALYADAAVSIEMEASPVFDKETKGIEAIVAKGHKFNAMIEKVHSMHVSEPLVAGDAIAFLLEMDVEMKGRGRTTLQEIAVYQVADGKVVSEQFFQ